MIKNRKLYVGLLSLVSISMILAVTVTGPWSMVFWGSTAVSCVIFYARTVYEEKKRLAENKSYVNQAIQYRERERALNHQEHARHYCSVLSVYKDLENSDKKKVLKITDTKTPIKSSLVIERTRE